jgi:hypothetical protein
MAAPLVRSARSQVVFREVNDRIREMLDSAGPMEILCECIDTDCTATIILEREEYDRARSDPAHFLVVPGHERLEVERVVHQSDRSLTVEKTVRVDIAGRNDPRSRPTGG